MHTSSVLVAFAVACLLRAVSASPFFVNRGQRDVSTMIVGGVEARRGEFPYIVEIQLGSRHWCGGSIVNENWILTAAHCGRGGEESSYSVIAGQHDLHVTESQEQRRSVELIVNHKDYRGAANDIAVWKVSSPFVFNEFVQPVILASRASKATEFNVAGWGALEYHGPSATVLMKVTVPFVQFDKCKQLNAKNPKLPPVVVGMICAGRGGKDSCSGDSGGPLVAPRSGTQVGVVSWGHECARAGFPGVYADVAYYHKWIVQNTV